MNHLPLTASIACSALLLLAAPAAAIPSGYTGKVKIASKPSGALATAENGSTCRTPCSLRLPIKSGGTIQVTMDGYQPQTVEIGSHVDGGTVAMDAINSARDPFAAAVNALALAVWGSASYKTLDARKIAVQLVPVGSGTADTGGAGEPAAAAAGSNIAPAAEQKDVYGPVIPARTRAAVTK